MFWAASHQVSLQILHCWIFLQNLLWLPFPVQQVLLLVFLLLPSCIFNFFSSFFHLFSSSCPFFPSCSNSSQNIIIAKGWKPWIFFSSWHNHWLLIAPRRSDWASIKGRQEQTHRQQKAEACGEGAVPSGHSEPHVYRGHLLIKRRLAGGAAVGGQDAAQRSNAEVVR